MQGLLDRSRSELDVAKAIGGNWFCKFKEAFG